MISHTVLEFSAVKIYCIATIDVDRKWRIANWDEIQSCVEVVFAPKIP